MCSPTRAALLTGQNHHAVGMGFLPEVPISFPGYNGRIPKSAAALPRLLRDAGYSTFAVGKWHLTPRWEVSASGPFTQWPLGLGFERYYGFLAGDTNQWAPELVRDNGFIEPPGNWRDGYHLTEDLTDQALRFVRDAQHATPGKPFLLWYATGAQHAPHQAPAEWIERFRGHFDDGWDRWRETVFARQLELGIVPAGTEPSSRPEWVTPWGELPADHRRLFARMMEVYAGFLAHTDAQVGRLLGGLEEMGLAENTLVVCCSDNGASAEGGPHGSFNELRFTHDRLDVVDETVALLDQLGGPRSYEHYPWGWAWAGNTPFKLWKRYTWLGGVRTPLVVRWPRGIPQAERGAVRSQFCHAVDLLPTVLAVTGVDRPAEVDGVAQRSLDGASIAEHLHRSGRPVTALDPVLRTARFRVRCTWTDGRPRPITSAPNSRSNGNWLRGVTASRTTNGRCTTCRTISPKCTTSPTPSRSDWRHCNAPGGSRPNAIRCCHSTTRSPVAASPWSPTRGRRVSSGATGPGVVRSPRTSCRRWVPGSPLSRTCAWPTRKLPGSCVRWGTGTAGGPSLCDRDDHR